MSFAIIEVGGKQYQVEQGSTISVEKLPKEEGESITFHRVVLFSADDNTAEVGAPFVEGKTVEGKIIEQGKGEKIRIYKKNAKKRYVKTQGHRQCYTKVEITKIA